MKAWKLFIMEHLLLPAGAVLTEKDEIPCIYLENYRGLPFKDYPSTNPDYEVPQDSQAAASIQLYPSPLGLRGLERSLQTWLFFGLLQEILGNLFKEDDFVRHIGDGAGGRLAVSTAKLRGLLDQWMHRVRDDRTLGQLYFEHLQECLRVSAIALTGAMQGFDPKIKLGIAATAEVLVNAVSLASKIRGIVMNISIEVKSWGNFDDTLSRFESMRQSGWCSAQATRTLEKFYSLQAKYFLSHMKKDETTDKHKTYSSQHCNAMQIDPGTYKSRHRQDPCHCKQVDVSQTELFEVLRAGKVALLDLQLDQVSDMVSVSVVAAEAGSCYVALSHVWADGLGNPHANALPHCQLRHVFRLLKEFETHELSKDNKKMPYLWLDTLCCPTAPKEAQLLALGLMPQTYRKATHVLVLDSSLQGIDCSSLHPIEASARLFTSAWMFRLWTLQEATLATRLWIQFRDGIVELRELFDCFDVMLDSASYDFTGELMAEYGKLRITSGQSTGGELWYMTEALRCRSVSVPSDEPFCVGTLLGLDVKIIGKELKDRMRCMWSLIPNGRHIIPSQIVFYIGPKLAYEGFGWAPSTLLGVANTSQFMLSPENPPAFPSPRGLMLSLAAFRISVPERVDGILSRPSSATFALLDFLKYDSDRWCTLFSSVEQKKFSPKSDQLSLFDIIFEGDAAKFEILLEKPMNKEQVCSSRAGLLVEFTDIDQGRRYVQSRRQASVRLHDRATCNLLNSIFRRAQALHEDEASLSQEIIDRGKTGEQDPLYLSARKSLLEIVELAVGQLLNGLDHANFPDGVLGLTHHPRNAIFSLLSRFYRRRYLVMGERFPSTQAYCVD
jgi:hypothetical protein